MHQYSALLCTWLPTTFPTRLAALNPQAEVRVHMDAAPEWMDTWPTWMGTLDPHKKHTGLQTYLFLPDTEGL